MVESKFDIESNLIYFPKNLYFKETQSLKDFLEINKLKQWRPNYSNDFDFTYYFKNSLIEPYVKYKENGIELSCRFRYEMHLLYNMGNIGKKFLVLTKNVYLVLYLTYMSRENKLRKLNDIMKILFNIDDSKYQFTHNKSFNVFVISLVSL